MYLRLSKNPHKQFLWWLLMFDSRLSRKYRVGLDAGCANMGNRRYFKTKDYIGLDPDRDLLNAGLKKNHKIKVINSTILDAPTDLSADFVQCIQVLVNAEFIVSETIENISRLVEMTNKEGVLIFNTGKKSQIFVDDLSNLLEKSFREVVKVEYGGSNISSKSSFIVAFLKSILMLISAKYRLSGVPQKTYFKCIGKL